MRHDPYRDHRAPDGLFASGWRYVRKGGRVKAAGTWYSAEKLKEIVGEYVLVFMGDYWMGDVQIHRGACGCSGWYCNAAADK